MSKQSLDEIEKRELRAVCFELALRVMEGNEGNFCQHEVMEMSDEIFEYIVSGKIQVHQNPSEN